MTGTHMGTWLRAQGAADHAGCSYSVTKLRGKSSHVASLDCFYLETALSK